LNHLIRGEYYIHENIIRTRNVVISNLEQVIKQWIENVKANKGIVNDNSEEEGIHYDLAIKVVGWLEIFGYPDPTTLFAIR